MASIKLYGMTLSSEASVIPLKSDGFKKDREIILAYIDQVGQLSIE